MSIHVEHLRKRFGEHVAVDDVSFEVQTGELIALLGPSGGGKSTILRIIAGLEPADQGVVRFDGAEVDHLRPRDRRVGFVFQHYALFRHLSVWETSPSDCGSRRCPARKRTRGWASSSSWWAWNHWVTGGRPSSRAASANGSLSPAPWRLVPGCCCWTSRSPPWTPKFDRSSASGYGGCTTRCTSPASSSLTTRRRPSRSPIACW